MIDSQYIKYGALSGFLLLCTLMLNTSVDNENSVFAQNTSSLTPAPEEFSTDESSPNSSLNNDDDNDNDESTGSSGSDDDDDDGQSTT